MNNSTQDDALLAVNNIFDNFQQNYDILLEIKEVSFALDYKGQLEKVALLACASYFETKIINIVLCMLETNNCELTSNFIEKKALSRQYHTLFDWKGKNANSFFSLFGQSFKEFMKSKVEKDDQLSMAIKNFLELGNLRNKLAHDNYATFTLNLTVDDIKKKFSSAHIFVLAIGSFPNEYRESVKKT